MSSQDPPQLTRGTEDPWRPIVTGAEATAALEVVEQIAAGIELRLTNEQLDDLSLAAGHSGLAVFFGYLAQRQCSVEHAERSEAHLDEAGDLMSADPVGVGLYHGFTGVAWAIDHLECSLDTLLGEAASQQAGAEQPPDESAHEDDDSLADVDAALEDVVSQSPWQLEYDVISGLVGIGIYALARMPRSSAKVCVEGVVQHLEELAEHRTDGITWFTRAEFVPPLQRDRSAAGYYNLGVAHGVPGVIALLAQARAAGVAVSAVDSLLEGAVDWLFAQEHPTDGEPRFGYDVTTGVPANHAMRPAWCYGDLGIAAVLASAARLVDEPRWKRKAADLALGAARRERELSSTLDAGLCHGAAGVSHLYNRIYQATGEGELGDAARKWFGTIFDLRQPDRPFGGFPSRVGSDWVDTPGFLEGAAGVGLAILAAISPLEPAWDQVLLVSSP